MREYQQLDYDAWLKHTEYLTDEAISRYFDLKTANDAILEICQYCDELEEVEGIDYTDQTKELSKAKMDLEYLKKYGEYTGLLGRVEETETILYDRIHQKVVEKFSLIKMEDIKIPNVYKIQTATVHVLENDLRIQKSLEEELSLEDFVSVIKKKERASYIDGFTDVIYRGAAKEEVGVQVEKTIEDVNYLILDEIPPEEIEDLEVATYLVNHKAEIDAMTTRGEFDHCGSSAGMMFLSEMADCLIIPAVVKAITGYDYITGEQLTGIQRGAKGVQAAVSIFVVGKLAASGVGLGAAVISKVGEEAVEEVACTGGLAALSAVCKKCNVSPEMERYLMLAAVASAAVLQQKVEGVGEATAESIEQIGKRDELVEGVVDIAGAKPIKEFLESGDEVVEEVRKIDVWTLKPTERGNAIESALAKGEYKDWYNIGQEHNGYFKAIDFQKGNIVVSVKSIDPTLPSYSGNGATNKILEYLEKLDLDITVDGKFANKVLDVRIPKGTMNDFDMNLLLDEAKQRGIKLCIKEVE